MKLEDVSFLYVEDDPHSRQVMELILTKAAKVRSLVIFEDSQDFPNRLQKLDPIPDIILLDIHVDPYDGFEMLAFVHQSEKMKNAKVIALTASVMNEEVEAMREKGFDGTISKPLSVSTFPGLIQHIAEGESVWYVA